MQEQLWSAGRRLNTEAGLFFEWSGGWRSPEGVTEQSHFNGVPSDVLQEVVLDVACWIWFVGLQKASQ